ncbi:MAG TPA: DUF523 domain-containing protein [Halanaerobiaceae bacterium]|jgi:uncharacterized protein YbbK (DUF523 family)|nr:DUF523 domain-containing protein [Bacillota bacterium]HHU91528.1 DUF523 domain-containing protein [Halanaerobiaceae bacterium]HOA41247.1 DUF523 domain-containing protein [Halanaerobiales bacterium]HPZ63265.1 DUF523 domain-containing protein [Halanaerobiales bacterium]HQD04491.1 DUF523 domain-containing protein [Halanaerobiales bacterium]
MILVSACLLGENVRYDGANTLNEELLELLKGKEILPICPEVAGDLPVPRPPAEIVNGDGNDVLAGRARVENIAGDDVTPAFLKGARKVLVGLDLQKIDFAILKSRSPSCGIDQIYNGQFNGQLREGPGVTAAYLRSKGIEVYSEEEPEKIKDRIKE